MFRIQKKYILFGVASFVTVIGIGAFLFNGTYTENKNLIYATPEYDAQEDIAHWSAFFEKGFDPIDIYQSFLQSNYASHISIQHVRAHVIGEVLYEHIGVEGISICDSQFGFGCFHGLFTVGFASEGQEFVKEADAMCVERYGVFGTGCQHGIGHGIVEYVGHSRLGEALSLCEDTSQPTPLLGCTSGVFMEFNTPFTILPGQEQLQPYPFSEDSPYAECDSVEEKYKASCFYELGGWWETVLQGDKKKMGLLCAEVSDSYLRDMCALGLGNIIGPTTQYDVKQSSKLCFEAPHTVQVLCHAGVAWSMYANPEYRDRVDLVCKELSGTDQEVCEDQYNLAE